MQIDDQELARRLSSPRNLVNHLATKRGRTAGSSNLSEQERDTIAELHIVEKLPQKEIADAYGISQGTVSNCVTGAVGSRPVTQTRKEKREALAEEVKDTALTKLMCALGLLDADKLSECNARELSHVARNLASVRSSFEEKNIGVQNNVQINLYAPQQKNEDKYKVIDV